MEIDQPDTAAEPGSDEELLNAIRFAGKRYKEVDAMLRRERNTLETLIARALRQGIPMGKVVEAAPLSPAWVRKIARRRGIQPPARWARPYRREQ